MAHNDDRRPFPGDEIVLTLTKLAAEYLAAGQHAFQVNRDAAGVLRLLDALQLDPPAALSPSRLNVRS